MADKVKVRGHWRFITVSADHPSARHPAAEQVAPGRFQIPVWVKEHTTTRGGEGDG